MHNLLHGMFVKKYPTIFSDNRGSYNEIFNTQLFEHDLKYQVKQVSIVDPVMGSLRGFHGDSGTSKVISVLEGTIFIAVIDPRQSSPSYGKCFSMEVNAADSLLFYLPSGLGNAFLALSKKSKYLYLQNTYYGEFEQFTIRYNDPKYNVPWPNMKYIISKRDQ